MENTSPSNTSSDFSGAKMAIGMLWVISLVVVGIIGFSVGQGMKSETESPDKTVLAASMDSPTSTPTSPSVPVAEPTLAAVATPACKKYGLAQKWEYLTSYEVKEGESLQSIAQKELKDSSRVDELLQLNGVGPFVVGSTLYLPPPSIPKSSGHIRLVQGKVSEKNGSYWHVKFAEEKDSQGLLIPTHWFSDITNKDSFATGDCVKVLLDDGFKVFSIALQ